jgi:hypothetical protein
MPPFVDLTTLHDLIVGAAASGIWSLVANAGIKAASVFRKQMSATSAPDFYTVAAAQVCEEFCQSGSSEWSRLKSFLASPEVESVVRQIYADNIVDNGQARHVEEIKEEFVTSFALHLDVSAKAVEPVAGAIFTALFRECEKHLSNAVNQNILSAHEAKSSARYVRLLGEIATVRKNLDLLRSAAVGDVATFIRFEEKYRSQVGSRHWFIQPPHLETARKVAIDELYVTPTFVSAPARKRSESRQISLEQFLAVAHRTVILGNPGGGKSTLALKLCHDLATRYEERIYRRLLATPMLVVLREYGSQKKTDHCSILQFIESQAASRYQLPAPLNALEYLLLNGRLVVVFDGLDELLDTSYRQEISNDVESFCNLYPSVPVLVTSREVGYEQAPLDSKQFRLWKIAPFDDDQVRDYVSKWFARDEDLTPAQQRQKAQGFLSESELAPDLRSNPLMLGLMCNLYRVDGYIPRNRPEIYEKCSLMLFERWDKSRGIVVPLPFEEHIRPAMQHLAHWIYSQESLQGGVTRSTLIEETASYLNRWVFEDPRKATKAAENFIEFCTGRAWVFTDTGTTAEGEKLYQFTHRTFLEYFTATYLFSTHPTPDQLGELLRPRIAKQEWDVVALLAYQIQSRRVQGAGDKLLSSLLETAIQLARQERWNTLLFAARCLESIVPSPPVRRAVMSACIQACVASDFPPRARQGGEGAMAMIAAVFTTSPENRVTAGEAVEQILSSTVQSGTDREGAAAYEVAFRLSAPIFYRARESAVASEGLQFWSDVGGRIMTTCSPCLERLATKDLQIATIAYEADDVPLEKVVEWHGITGLFRAPHSHTFLFWWPPLALRLLMRLSHNEGVGDERLRQELAKLGRILASAETPWVEWSDKRMGPEYRYFADDVSRLAPPELHTDPAPSPDAAFGVFGIVAVLFESDERYRSEILAWLERFGSPLVTAMSPAFLSRFDPAGRSGLTFSIGAPYDEIIARWAASQVSFVHLSRPAVRSVDSDDTPDQVTLPLTDRSEDTE